MDHDMFSMQEPDTQTPESDRRATNDVNIGVVLSQIEVGVLGSFSLLYCSLFSFIYTEEFKVYRLDSDALNCNQFLNSLRPWQLLLEKTSSKILEAKAFNISTQWARKFPMSVPSSCMSDNSSLSVPKTQNV